MKAILSSLYLIFLSAFLGYGQYVFDPNLIHDIEINFYDSNWDHLLDSLATENSGTGSGTGRIMAAVTIDGVFYDSCGVRYKGNSSMDTTSNKNPFNIDLNYIIPGQRHHGKDKFKLANCFADPSMIREVLTYELANQYMDCPRANFTKLYINGDYRGIYTNTESIDNEFLDEHYGSSSNPFFKCDPVSFELYGDNSNLAYHPDSMAYDTLYDMKSLYGLAALQDFTYELEFNPGSIETHLDVDRVLWFLAFSSAVVHNDGYTAFAHNFYIYKQNNGRWSIILWDVNMSFGGLLWNGSNFLPLGLTELQEQDPFIHAGTPGFRPLIVQLLSIPKYRKAYVAHFRTIIEENVDNNYYMQRAQFWHDLIDPEVPNEPYPFYTYNDFVANITTDYGTWIEFRPGIENLMQGRQTFLNTLQDFNYVQPAISNVSAPIDPDPFTTVTVTAEVILETGVWLGYRDNEYDVFTRVQMFDDGLHNDGTAGDDIYGVDIPVGTAEIQYYIYAQNAEAAKFHPVRAEYEFLTLTPKKGLVINELCANNQSIMADQAGDYDDWVEFYNNTNDPILLNNYFLSDDPDNLFKWLLPNYTLQPDSYFFVWADNEITEGSDHANFKLNSNGESLYLSTIADSIIDYVIYSDQTADITYGRLPNGTGPFNYMLPTFAAENTTLAGQTEVSLQEMAVYPNPCKTETTVRVENFTETEIYLYNLKGELVSKKPLNGTQTTIDVSALSSGTYIVKLGTGEAMKIIIQ